MITKEAFLYETDTDEVFCVLHEFLCRLNEKREQEGREEVALLDHEIGEIAEAMIEAVRSSVWLEEALNEEEELIE